MTELSHEADSKTATSESAQKAAAAGEFCHQPRESNTPQMCTVLCTSFAVQMRTHLNCIAAAEGTRSSDCRVNAQLPDCASIQRPHCDLQRSSPGLIWLSRGNVYLCSRAFQPRSLEHRDVVAYMAVGGHPWRTPASGLEVIRRPLDPPTGRDTCTHASATHHSTHFHCNYSRHQHWNARAKFQRSAACAYD